MNKHKTRRRLPLIFYRPQPVFIWQKPKINGGERVFGEPTELEKKIQNNILSILEPRVIRKLSERSYAYFTGRSQYDAVSLAYSKMLEGYVYAVVIDLTNFFELIPHKKLQQILTQLLPIEWVHLLMRFPRVPGIEKGREIKKTRGVWQGSPISGLLANIYLDSADKYCEQNKWELFRYADDILLLFKTCEEAELAYEQLSKFLNEELSLTLNEAKSNVFPHYAVEFLGYSFTDTYPIRLVPSSTSSARLIGKIEMHLKSWQAGGNDEAIAAKLFHQLNGTFHHLHLVNDWEDFGEVDRQIQFLIYQAVMSRCYIRESKFKFLYRVFPKKSIANRLASALEKEDMMQALKICKLFEVFLHNKKISQ